MLLEPSSHNPIEPLIQNFEKGSNLRLVRPDFGFAIAILVLKLAIEISGLLHVFPWVVVFQCRPINISKISYGARKLMVS